MQTDVMDDNLHALEQLVEAVHELVTNAGRVQERLFEARLHLDRIRLDDVPEGKLRIRFLAIRHDLAFEPKRDQANLTASFQAMADDDASDIARRILRLHYELVEARPCRPHHHELGHRAERS